MSKAKENYTGVLEHPDVWLDPVVSQIGSSLVRWESEKRTNKIHLSCQEWVFDNKHFDKKNKRYFNNKLLYEGKKMKMNLHSLGLF